MDDLHTILQGHRSRQNPNSQSGTGHNSSGPKDSLRSADQTESSIPDIFFDKILVEFKMNRHEVLVLMYLYRLVWCKPNLYRIHGISNLISHSEMGKQLGLTIDEIYHSLRKLEELQFISTIRMGQYFVRRYFSKELDDHFGQDYDDFDS